MTNENIQHFSFEELCGLTELPSNTITDMVDYGIVDPVGGSQDNWEFTTEMIAVAKKATRLHRDLDIDWPGIALAISLLEDLEETRRENQQLHRLLDRFIVR